MTWEATYLLDIVEFVLSGGSESVLREGGANRE
jgi:hypothetical protein